MIVFRWDESHRKLLPIETFSVAAGIKGGIAGGTAMIVPARSSVS